MWKNDRVAQVACLEYVTAGGDAAALQTMRVITEGNKMNPATAVAVVAVFPRRDIRSCDTSYSPQFLGALKAAIEKHGIRILLGIFTCPAQQVVDIARSCGAAGTRPFCQTFYRWTVNGQPMDSHTAANLGVHPLHGGNYVTHPSCVLIFGPCSKIAYAPLADSPWLPDWMGMGGLGFNTLARSLTAMPMWEEDQTLRSGGAKLVDLGFCSQKTTNMSWWTRGVHQLLLHLGTARTGAQCRAAKTQRSNWRYTGPQKKGKWSKYPQ